jgi:drug/metabolite transporter (DMT)-like permease
MTQPSAAVKSTLILSVASLIWGFAFVAQRLGMEHVGPFFFNGTRTVLGALTVWLVVCLLERRAAPLIADARSVKTAWRDSATLRGGVLCGLALFAASNFQQVGLVYVEAAKAGFLTTLYIVLVPLAGLFFGRRGRWNIWTAVAISAIGLYLLCLTAGNTIAIGDLIVLLGAACWTVQILLVDHFVNRADVFRMCAVQFLTCGLLSLAVFPFADGAFVAWSWATLPGEFWAAIPAILFAGVLSSGVAFTCQALGQKTAPPAVASLVMSLEAPFATLAGFTLLHERFTPREAIGCVFMFAAILIAQLPQKQAAEPGPAGP